MPPRKPKTRGTPKFCSKRCREKHWAENNRERHRESVKRNRRKRYERNGCCADTYPAAKALKAWMIELKSQPCADCGHTFEICCMDFDHRDGETKEYNVGTMFAHHYSRELIEKEVAKCDLICACCHRIRTRNRRMGSGLRRISKDGPIESGMCGD